MTRITKNSSLADDLDLRRGEDLEMVIERALPVVRTFWPHETVLFEAYYDLEGGPRTYTELAKIAGCTRQVIQHKVKACLNIVKDTLEIMRVEKAKPGDFLAWKPTEFFSYERAAQMGIKRDLFSRLRHTLERGRWQSMAALTDEDESYMLRSPKVGEAVLNAFKILLATERLTFSK